MAVQPIAGLTASERQALQPQRWTTEDWTYWYRFLDQELTHESTAELEAQLEFSSREIAKVNETFGDRSSPAPWSEQWGVCIRRIQRELTRRQGESSSQIIYAKLPHLTSFAQALKQKMPIDRLITALHGVKLQGHGATLYGHCPLHDDRHPSLAIWPNDGRWWCFGACGQGGDIYDWLIAASQARGFREAVEYVAHILGETIPWDSHRAIMGHSIPKLVS